MLNGRQRLKDNSDARQSECNAKYIVLWSTASMCVAFAASLSGLDTFVFSGGIGENTGWIRARICDGLNFLKIEIDEKCNMANICVIST